MTADQLVGLRSQGRAAVVAWRARPTSLSSSPAGTWFDDPFRRRMMRRILLRVPGRAYAVVARTGARGKRLAGDAAFWSGVRSLATPVEWRRLTASYVVLCYHRFAGASVPGEERIDVPTDRLAMQLRVLRLLAARPARMEKLVAFHDGRAPTVARRSYVITVDDGFADAVAVLRHIGPHRPQLFVPTDAIGATATWAPSNAPVASWPDLRSLRDAGVAVGSHGRRHVPLTALDDVALKEELNGSLDDLRANLAAPLPVVAYPNGCHDERVRAATESAGYVAAYATDVGRNGAGTDRFALRRITPKAWDSPVSFAWKFLTGEPVGPRWEAHLKRRYRERTGRP